MMEELIGIFSVLVSIISAAVSVVFAQRARRDIRNQGRLQVMALRQERYAAFQQWADEVIEVMTEAIFLCDAGEDLGAVTKPASRTLLIRQRLSALVDRGRLFLENEAREAFSEAKPIAYQGFRRAELDPIVEAFRALRDLDLASTEQRKGCRKELWEQRKNFVSGAQLLLSPRGREQEIEALVREL
jgi:hypothetical protein